jgi:lysophospholipase L1-like esterase
MRRVHLAASGFGIFAAFLACSSAPTSNDEPAKNGANVPHARDAGTVDILEAGTAGTSPDASVNVVLSPVHYIGRFDRRDAKGPRASWPGSRIVSRFSGTGATLRIHETGSGGMNPWYDQLDVSIDGAPPTLLKLDEQRESYPLATGLADAEHDVVITKRTESWGTIQFLGLDSTEGRPLVPTPPPASRFIEFVGDSITCGFGVLGADASCSFSPDTEDEALAYGALTASALSAGHAAIAFSGIGVYSDNNGGATDQMPVRFFRTLSADPTSVWDFHVTPDVVVVNLGTNDFNGPSPTPPTAEFEAAYGTFLGKLRAHYPKAYLVVALSSMMTDGASGGPKNRTPLRTSLQKIVQTQSSTGDSRVSYFEFDEQSPTDGYGCGYHPSQTTQKQGSVKLVAHIEALTGW